MTKTESAIRKVARRFIWVADYPTAKRRGHTHRCRACWKVMKAGESARWLRWLSNGKTWVVHSKCEDTKNFELTWKECFEIWAIEQTERDFRR